MAYIVSSSNVLKILQVVPSSENFQKYGYHYKNAYNSKTVRAIYKCHTYLESSEQMQVNDVRKKSVGQIIWLQFPFKVRIFYCAQFIFGDRDKKTCISNTV